MRVLCELIVQWQQIEVDGSRMFNTSVFHTTTTIFKRVNCFVTGPKKKNSFLRIFSHKVLFSKVQKKLRKCVCIGQCHKDKSEWERWLKVCVWILMKPTRFPINSFIYVCLSRKFCIKFSWSCRHNLTNRSANYNENEFKNRNTVVIYTKTSECVNVHYYRLFFIDRLCWYTYIYLQTLRLTV